ncbi:MAG: DNA adenine methylase [Patescibacteria group bacterium]|nr:DNA adenine methylase [Patescibacteria group bacterium]
MMNRKAKPFLKWAGGKTQIVEHIAMVLPKFVYKEKFTYIEPFVGSGAVLFWILNNFSKVKKAVINDVNEDLIHTYKTIASNPKELISILQTIQSEFHELEKNDEAKKEYYYSKRALYNQRKEEKTTHAALFIFLNRTCFNGLYRVNRKNEFNVPMGNYKRPTICDKENILAVSRVLQKVEILCGDFEETLNYADKHNTLFYFDPPYKPLSETSNFNSYTKDGFDDAEQIRLRNFCHKLDTLGYTWILSNSDVKSKNEKDNFFDELYSGFNIERVNARRNINSNPEKRGALKELLITNQFKNQNYVNAI